MRIVLAAPVLLGLTLAACGDQSTSPAADAEAFDLPADQVMRGITHNLSQDGIRRAVINSDTAFSYEDTRKFDLIGLDVVFFNDVGGEAGHLTATRGEYDLANSLFVARDSVVLISPGPTGERRLLTDELYYDVKTDRIWSDVAFTLVEDGQTSRGTSFRSDSRFETWTVTGLQTTGTVEGEGGLSF